MYQGIQMKHLLTRIVFICIQIVGLMLSCGCDFRSDPTATQTSSLPSSSAPAISQTSTSTMIAPDGQFDLKLEKAPDIVGTEKLIMEIKGLKRIVYRSLDGNPYGVTENKIIGEFKHEVYLGEQCAGGVVLAAPVVTHYLKDALGNKPAGQANWLLPLPVDISDCCSADPVKIDLSAKPLIDRPYYIRITSSEELGVVNILDNQQDVVIDEFKMFGLQYIISQRSNESSRIIEGEEMAFLFVIVRFMSMPRTDQDYSFGDRIGTTTDSVLAGLTSVRGPFLEHKYDCILSIEGCPVFVMANQKWQEEESRE